jgi:GAF domain-containing protein
MAEETANVGVRASGLSLADKLRLLLEITRKISRSLDLEEVLAQVMDTLDSLLPYHAAGIYIIRRDPHLSEGGTASLVFHAEAVRGYDIEELMELRLKLGEGLIGWVAPTSATSTRAARRAPRSSPRLSRTTRSSASSTSSPTT